MISTIWFQILKEVRGNYVRHCWVTEGVGVRARGPGYEAWGVRPGVRGPGYEARVREARVREARVREARVREARGG